MAKKEKLITTEVDMAKDKKTSRVKSELELEENLIEERQDPIHDSICPSCGKKVEGHKCRLCGATKSINSVSGNVIWMRNGRVVKAFKDEKQAYIRMAEQYHIPRSDWPEEFR